MGYYNYYKYRAPRSVRNGLKARSRHGKIGSTWWSQKWLSIVEGYGSEWQENRLERGRRYARSGQVMAFRIEKGRIAAKVQGSMREPYSVTITVKTMGEDAWAKVIERMASSALYAAKLLSGEMPEEIGKLAKAGSTNIFPAKKEFLPACTCPDGAVPCKHIAAVCYIIAEELDKDPFLLFKFRGMDKDEMLEGLRKLRKGMLPKEKAGKAAGAAAAASKSAKATPKEELQRRVKRSPETFWEPADFSQLSYSMELPSVNAAIIRRLGEPQFWKAQKDFVKLMESAYERVSKQVQKRFAGSTGEQGAAAT